ncbi:bacterioferritin [Chitiniphilus purpureus]|uniref:Bacterioferritin n=1 Tax=Chitiniphilus purpureus TaxID=2981137 RepID=A0ABY6DJF6_9NEIS|nr:bacterioferritin [Chitiniphilus sp. CD1]UXY14373.1 bacterioferritin [Chitiniphilus sp. CD1]
MQGHPQIIAALNALLAAELSSIDQYFVHSQMYHDWGYARLYQRIDHERQDEIGHATRLITRILFLGGTPDIASRSGLRVGADVPAMLANDLATEYEVAAALKRAISLAESLQDFVTRNMLLELLDDTEEDHARWLEQQLGLIKAVGLENYLQSQIGKD